MTLFAGSRGDQCIIFRDQVSTGPLGGINSDNVFLVHGEREDPNTT